MKIIQKIKQIHNRAKALRLQLARRCERYAPPGLSLESMKNTYIWCVLFSFGGLLWFVMRFFYHKDKLFEENQLGERFLREGAVMADFDAVLGLSFVWCALGAMVLAAYIVYFYCSYHSGSKSIYTMRRLPDRWEIHRRSIPLPLLAAASIVVLRAVLVLICFAAYMGWTPDQCLPNDQWTILWREII